MLPATSPAPRWTDRAPAAILSHMLWRRRVSGSSSRAAQQNGGFSLTCAVRVLKPKPSGLSANSQKILLRQTESGQLAHGKLLQRFTSIAKKHRTQLISQ